MNVYIMCGPIGSGKSYIAKRLYERVLYRRFDPDRLIKGEWTREKSNAAWDTIHTLVKHYLKQDKPFIVDSSQALKISRRRLTQFIREHRKNVNIICLFVTADFRTCLMRNNHRERKVPEGILREYYDNIMDNPPSRRDGYDEVITIDNSDSPANGGCLWTTSEPWPEGWYRD